ncbi:serine/threonine-protein phosphatase [Streptomyces pactum]|uniref:Serine/threonine-protein phosphatase n=1 Tax=Streptomyces pactum TaxID=68249 RepID=A0ABS0NRW1_9ACTN|nr:PP2C family protein-serine/threonine phosphatase [Streptomyces pactum]MBH5337876.1 serine/threonine-protein phosphatase [Streptomyces pactum]
MIRSKAAGRARAGAARLWRLFVLVLPALWILSVLAWERWGPQDIQSVQLLAAAPAIACAGSGRRRCVVMGGLSAICALLPISAERGDRADTVPTVGTCAAIVAVVAAGCLTTGRRRRLVKELEQVRAVATAAQDVVLRPLPARLAGVTLAGGHLSATRGAAVGGDLYEALSTPHGVRVVIGDVRGHGVAAMGGVAAVLGSFREAAHDEAELPGVLRRLERAWQRHQRERALAAHPSGAAEPHPAGRCGRPRARAGDRPGPPGGPDAGTGPGLPGEEFVTVLLLEIRPDGTVSALNCGHPWPYVLSDLRTGGPRVRQAGAGEALPPLGLFPLPGDLAARPCARLRPGQALVLHTDGAEDARDGHGAFFPLRRTLAQAAGQPVIVPATVVAEVQAGVLAHTGGRLPDDVALLVLRQDRLPGGPPTAGRAAPAGEPHACP